MDALARVRKAIAAGVTTGVGVYGTILATGAHVDSIIALGAAVGAGIIAAGIVYFTPNAPPATPAKA